MILKYNEMFNSRESTIVTQLSITSNSELNYEEESCVFEGLEEESMLTDGKIVNELVAEIDVINEDRERLREEREKLKRQLAECAWKKVQVDLLTKISAKALKENKRLKESLELKENNVGDSRKPFGESNFVLVDSNRHSSDLKPTPSHQRPASRIRILRNPQKYPKPLS
jgi:hypothetical protein